MDLAMGWLIRSINQLRAGRLAHGIIGTGLKFC